MVCMVPLLLALHGTQNIGGIFVRQQKKSRKTSVISEFSAIAALKDAWRAASRSSAPCLHILGGNFEFHSSVIMNVIANSPITGWPLVGNEGINLYNGILGIHSLIPY